MVPTTDTEEWKQGRGGDSGPTEGRGFWDGEIWQLTWLGHAGWDEVAFQSGASG